VRRCGLAIEASLTGTPESVVGLYLLMAALAGAATETRRLARWHRSLPA